jgi:hypothetical protein
VLQFTTVPAAVVAPALQGTPPASRFCYRDSDYFTTSQDIKRTRGRIDEARKLGIGNGFVLYQYAPMT